MEKYLILLLTITSFANSYSQAINFNWVKQLERHPGQAVEEDYFIGTDAGQNVYLAGNFRNTIDIDPGSSVFNLTSNLDNIFICKLDPLGRFVWGKQLGAGGLAVCKSLSVDANGNIYITGYFTGNADFDPGTALFNLTAANTANSDNKDIFISKLDTKGNFQWAKQVGGSGVDIATSINADVFGNVYTTGSFTGVIDIDPGSSSLETGSRGVVNAFIIKIDDGGNFIYGKILESNHNSVGEFIKTDNQGNVYATGHYNGTIDFDPGPGAVAFTATFNSQNTFLLKLDPLGNFVWVQQNVIGYDIAVDADQNVYTYDAQLSKYDKNGKLLWTKLVGGSPYSSFQNDDIKIDIYGNIYLTGMFRYSQDFDPGASVYNLTAAGNGFASDVFICKLDTNGDFIWAKTFGSYGEDYATGLAIDNSGNVYTTGVYNGIVDFDPGPDSFNLTAYSTGSIFVHKMSPCVKTVPTVLNISSCDKYTLNNISYDSSGNYTQSLRGSEGCDSLITLNLVIKRVTTNFSVTTCGGYKWNDRWLTTTGKYSDTFAATNGCDSIVNLDLTIKDKITSQIDTAICRGQIFAGYTTAGSYTDTFRTSNGCDSIVTTNLTVAEQPVPNLGLDIEICSGDSVILQPGNFDSYLWQDRSAQNYFIAKKSGLYSVTVSNACGVGFGQVMIKESHCVVYFPNVFTPNNDGKNDRFNILNPFNVTTFHLSIYNRYGQKVFETKDVGEGWNGKYKGQLLEAGTYVWFSNFKESGVSKSMNGTLLLIK